MSNAGAASTVDDNNVTEVFFQRTPCLSAHVYALKVQPESYLKDLQFLCECGSFAAVSSGVRACILASLHINSQHEAVTSVLKKCEATDIVKAAVLLDRPRKLRQLKEKIQRIEDAHPNLIRAHSEDDECKDDSTDSNTDTGEASTKKRKRLRKIDRYRGLLSAIESEMQEVDHSDKVCADAHAFTAIQELIQSSSVSGAFARKVRRWAKTCLKSDFLEYVMLALPTRPWEDLADLVHFSPSDFCVPYFLSEVHKERKTKKGKSDGHKANDVVVGAPEGSFVSRMRELVQNQDHADIDQQFFQLAEDFPQVYLMYSFIRMHPSLMSRSGIVENLASHVPLDTAMWFFEELYEASPMCESIIGERLKESGDIIRSAKSKATYGKLVDRILRFRHDPEEEKRQHMMTALGFSRLQAVVALRRFGGDMEQAAEWFFEDPLAMEEAVRRELPSQPNQETENSEKTSQMRMGLVNEIIPIADSRLGELKEYWKEGMHGAKMAVFGDASESMQCAIEASTIFATMVSVCFDAELSFFSYKLVQSPHEKPRSVGETLEVCDTIRASGCTSLAAALWPYFEKKKSMDVFVLVTDEHENEKCNGFHFADLFAEYKGCVNKNVSLVLVCVGKGDASFRQSLADNGITYKAVYIDESRPDLAKFDALLGQLALVSSRCSLSPEPAKVNEHNSGEDEFVIV
eukprot:CAMPEP_0197439492 /NCGR_PEP_ID=MMETSP1175-20131217/6219_1 /TAXON_ID=1003142 /ORGANISM="Triceratium dubium, Strain CCMP147" /LENGTH=688 /DNA_ID=CAMNT_0042969417 /DNA_START=67 /DNA_END=2133 /DNA_ORIENTATION=-